ncbi:MAG: sulfatase-like hydrolase/transferase, partial [Verrucomicrobiales bacterium]|nr:sulfatase-like hydrolase/transferase [Verrucomicrobiales bacterium]
YTKTNCWVTTDVKMANFEVEAEVMLPEDALEVKFNSGLAFRCSGEKGKPKGYQCEIDGAIPGKSGGIFGIGLGGWIYPNGPEQTKEYKQQVKGLMKPKDWNKFRVVAEGPRIRTYLNDKLIADIEDSKQLSGYFGIQHHGKGGTVKFRNIRAKRLPATPKPSPKSAGKPNILWITAEDMSPTLGCYGDEYATTPHLDKLATESVLFTNAFAASPVCSPSRSCLITGMYPVSMGTHQMRSAYPVPKGVKGFPSYLREAGFYTTNNVKTDYNNGDADRIIAESWDASAPAAHWRGREDGAPFFAVFNDMTSHQSRTMVWPYEAFQEHVQSKLSQDEIHDPAKALVPAYYPDTPTIRKTVARYYDCVSVMDKNVGRILAELEEDGLAEDTIIFFYSDHGSGMPRHKRLLLDSGMKVALMIRFPEKYKHLAPSAAGTKTDQLVSFVDFPPTVLSILGLEIPDYMQGKPFLGDEAKEERRFVYGSRDRVDEVFDTARSVRDKRYLYIRNYMPHLGYNQPSVFSDLGEIRDEITELAAKNLSAMTLEQQAYAGPNRPAEEFYDCKADPRNLNNLIGTDLSGEAAAALKKLRAAFLEQRTALLDPGSLPEDEMVNFIRNEDAPLRNVLLGETNHAPDLSTGWEVADMVGMVDDPKTFFPFLESGDVSQRYWAVIGLRNAAGENPEVHKTVAPLMEDIAPSVRTEAAGWLANYESYREAALKTLVNDLDHEDWWTALRSCRAIELLGEKARPVLPIMRKLYDTTRHEPGDQNLFLAFCSGAFLEKLGESTDPWDFTPGAGSFSADPKPDDEKEKN